MKPPQNPAPIVASAAWNGRQQAFALMATKCSHAQAQCLREIRESRAFEAYGLTWDEFCKQHAGMARAQADHLIRRLNEFGQAYFRLSELVRISDSTFRKLAPCVHDETIELNGQHIPLTPASASKIRAAIRGLRDEIHTLQTEMIFHRAALAELHRRLEDLLAEFARRARFPLPTEQRASLANLLRHTISRMQTVAKEFDRPAA